MMRARVSSLVLLAFTAQCAFAQENKVEPKRDELDVTMQIITDPDARAPDEVVRRIELPRKPARSATPSSSGKEAQSKGSGERDREAQGLGKEMSERAKERAQEAAEEREKARRSERNERQPGPPPEPPNPPRPNPPRN